MLATIVARVACACSTAPDTYRGMLGSYDQTVTFASPGAGFFSNPHVRLRHTPMQKEIRMSNVQLARQIYDLFGSRDIPAVLASFDSAIEWREAEGNPYRMDGTAFVGPQAIVEKLFTFIGEDWEAHTIHIEKLHDAGEHVVVEGRFTGKYKPTGRSIDAQLCHVLAFRNGKVTRFQQYVDTAQLQHVMGVRLEPPA